MNVGMRVLPLEDRLVLACAQPGEMTAAQRDNIRALVREGPDWARVIHGASAHGVTYLLSVHLKSCGCVQAVTHPHATALTHNLRCGTAQRVRQLARLGAVLRVLRGNGIDVIVCKGVHLANAAYFDPLARSMADADLLLHEPDLPRAVALLSQDGFATVRDCVGRDAFYARHHHLAPMDKGGFRMELHRHLFPPPWASALPVDGLWARAEQAEIAGCRVRVLAPEDLVIHICVHAVVGEPFHHGLRPLCDLAAVIGRFGDALDWRALTARARVAPLDRPVSLALSSAQRLLGVHVPPEVLAQLNARVPGDLANTTDALILAAGWRGRSVPRGIVVTADGKTLPDRLARALRRVFPPAVVMRRCYGLAPATAATLLLLYVYRPFELMIRYGLLATRLATGARQPLAALERQRLRAEVARWLGSDSLACSEGGRGRD